MTPTAIAHRPPPAAPASPAAAGAQAIEAARKAIAEADTLIERAKDEMPTRPIPRAPQAAATVERPSLVSMATSVRVSHASGRPIVASIGLVKLKETFDAFPPSQGWAEFVAEHLPYSVDQANELIGRAARRGGLATCASCGAEALTVCGCGAPYIPPMPTELPKPKPTSALDRAIAAIAEHPERSNVLIAKEIGVGEATVRRARQRDEVGDEVARTGRDGRTRRLPQAEPEPVRMPKAKARGTDVNLLIREALEFTSAFTANVTVWRRTATNPEDIAALRHTLHQIANEMTLAAQALDVDDGEAL